jgi:hypothetical protein
VTVFSGAGLQPARIPATVKAIRDLCITKVPCCFGYNHNTAYPYANQ